MEWIYLLIAGALEIIWAYTLDISDGFTILIPTLITIVLVLVCFYFLEKAIPKLGIGVSYASFTAIGTIGTYVISVLTRQQDLNILSVLSLVLIILGIVGLKSVTNTKEEK